MRIFRDIDQVREHVRESAATAAREFTAAQVSIAGWHSGQTDKNDDVVTLQSLTRAAEVLRGRTLAYRDVADAFDEIADSVEAFDAFLASAHS